MPKRYPTEFRHGAVTLVRASKLILVGTLCLGISAGCLRNRVGQDLVANGKPVNVYCPVLGVSKPGYYRDRNRATSPA